LEIVPYISRFTQPDSIVPLQSQGVQALDRYACTHNNPIKFNDPTGHCHWCIVTGIAGGIIAGAAYTISNQGSSFDAGEMAGAVGIGVLGGALIGTGVGAVVGGSMIATVATGAAVGAGAGILGSELGYTISAIS